MKNLPHIGWKEFVCLPLLGKAKLIAKIDTGAKLSALHASDIRIIDSTVKFKLMDQTFEAKVISLKHIKSSNGSSSLRPIIETEVEVGNLRFLTEVSLTDRGDMDLQMLLGRTALRRRFLVNAGRTFLLQPKLTS